jgi:5'-deoxynucleotidase YfbR-like HD superfamily hydrolase
MKPRVLLNKLLKLQRNYALTPRWMMTYERTIHVQDRFLKSKVNYEDVSIREPLLEHVGHLPIIANFLYPHIENKSSVDLGKALIMLSFHDIGETTTGDVFKYRKTKSHDLSEHKATRKLLNPFYFSYWKEYEERKTLTAKFAKSVDSFSPLLHELDNMPHTIKRFTHFKFGLEDIDKLKRPHFAWDKVLLAVFEEYLKIIRKEYGQIIKT